MRKIIGKKYLGKIQSYDLNTNTGFLLMSDGTQVMFHGAPARRGESVSLDAKMAVFTLECEGEDFLYAEDVEAL